MWWERLAATYWHGGVGSLPGTADSRFQLNGSSWSVEYWSRKINTTTTWPGLLATGAGGGGSGWMFYQAENINGLAMKRNNQYANANGVLNNNPGCMHHVVYSYSGGQARVYVDGQLNTTWTISWPTTPSNTIQVGINPEFPMYADALLGHVAFYDHALSSSQITSHFNAAGGSGSSYRDKVLGTGPLGYWGLNETSGASAADASAGQNNPGGYDNVSVGQSSLTPLSNSAAFNGSSSYISLGTSNLLTATPYPNQWTMEAWVNPSAYPAGGGVADVVRSDGSGGGYFIRLDSLGSFRSLLSFSAGFVEVSGGTVPRDRWSHLVVTYDGSVRRHYLNSELVGSWSENKTLSFSAGSPVAVGANPNLSGEWFTGKIDEVAVYGRALSTSQVRAHYATSGRMPPVPAAQTRGWSRHGRPTTVRRADPVDTGTGAFIDEVTDLATAASGVPVILARTYNSNDTTASGSSLGRGWSHRWAASLTVAVTGDVTVRTEDGAELEYLLEHGELLRPPGVTSVLRAVTGGYELARADQVRYRFDATGRLLSVKDRSGQGVTLGYDASNRPSTATDAAGRVFTFSYNAAGKLASVSAPAGDGRSVSYGYSGDLLTSVSDVRGGVTAYEYDAASRITKVTDPNGDFQVRNTYDASGRVIEQLDPLGNSTTFAWDAATQTSTMTDPKGKTWVDVYAGNVLQSTTEPAGSSSVAWDADLNPAGGSDARGNAWSATYDARGNLLTRRAPAPLSYVESWTYDANNNPLTYLDGRGSTTSYSYDAADRLTSSSLAGLPTTYSFDANGNQTAAGLDTFAYDMAGRMTAATDAALPATHAYAYDGDGKRIRTTTTTPLGASVTQDAWDTTQSVAQIAVQRDGTGAIARRFSYGLDRIATTTAGGATSFYHHDGIGSVSRITGATGSPQTTYTYEPFGRTRRVIKDDLLAADQPMRFAGEHQDATGLYHLRARQYDTGTGRFTATDPLAPDLGDAYVSAYAYVNQQPTLLVDPTGEKGRKIGAVGGLVAPLRTAPPFARPAPALPAAAPGGGACVGLVTVCVAVAAGAALGVGIYAINPGNYRSPLEEFGGDSYDRATRQDDWYRRSLFRVLGEKKGKAQTNPGAFRYDADGVSFLERQGLPPTYAYKMEARSLSGTKAAATAIFEDPLLAGCAALRTPSVEAGPFHWSVKCVGGKEGTQTTLSGYARARPDMITPG